MDVCSQHCLIISVDTVHVLGIILLDRRAIDNQAPFLIFDSVSSTHHRLAQQVCVQETNLFLVFPPCTEPSTLHPVYW
jgi:hypothetical protein